MATIAGNIQVLSLSPVRTRDGYVFTAELQVGTVPKTIVFQVGQHETGRDGRRRFVPISRAVEIARKAIPGIARGADVGGEN